MLTEKSRLLAAMHFETVDRPPCICPGGMMNMVTGELMDKTGLLWPDAHSDAVLMADLAKSVYEYGCFENYGVPFCMTVEAEAMGAKVDMGSCIYEPHVIEYAIHSVSEWEKLKKPDLKKGRMKTTIEAIQRLKEEQSEIPIIANLTGPISIASSLLEPVIYYKELIKKRESAHEYMQYISNHLIEFGIAQAKAGADIIAISDPSGTGEILGPKLFKEYAVEYINKVINGIKQEFPSIEFIVHICGQMRKVYDNLSEIACNTISFDALVSLKEAKRNLPHKAIMGNVSTYAIEFSMPQKVSDITRSCLKSGASIISPACGLGNQSPLANLQAILKTVKGEDITHE